MIQLTSKELKNRKLEKCYIAMYIVTYPIPLKKDDIIENTDIYIIYGIDMKSKRKIIDITFNKPDDNRFWLEKFEYIKSRGVETILFLITNKDKNIDKAMKILYNNTIIIESAINIISQFNKYLPSKRSSDIGQKFKKLFLAEDINAYEIELELIKETIKDYKIVTILLDKYINIIKNYYLYCKDIRKLIFPYFTIRDMQFKIRKLGNSMNYFNNLDEIIAALLEYIISFERSSSYYKKDWLQLMNIIYSNYTVYIEEYI